MKTFTKIWKVIAIGAIIAAGLSACGSLISIKPVELSEEELALRDTMENASWQVEKLTKEPNSPPPSLNGFEKITKMGYKESEWAISIEAAAISRLAGDGEKSRGRTITAKDSSGERTITLIGLDTITWYALTAPELPGITYYYYNSMAPGSTTGIIEIYKRGQ